MKINEIIKSQLVDNNEIEVTYSCGTTSCNGEYIVVKIGSVECVRVEGDNLKPFIYSLNDAVNNLKAELPNIHIIEKDKEFHFYYHGFNSCSTKKVPVAISNKDKSLEVIKTGVVTERYSLVGKSKVMEVIASHPDYELYGRSGYSFKGAQECRTDIKGIEKLCSWACCLDVEVKDNEIHVNGFSYSDMD